MFFSLKNRTRPGVPGNRVASDSEKRYCFSRNFWMHTNVRMHMVLADGWFGYRNLRSELYSDFPGIDKLMCPGGW